MSRTANARRRLLVGVVAHTDPAALHGTLDALGHALRPGDRVVVVPDGPDAAMAAALGADPRLAELEVLGSRAPGPAAGNAAAFNRLAAVGGGEGGVVFLESGARPAPDAIDRLAGALDHHDVGLAGPSTNDAWNEQLTVPAGPGDPAGLRAVAARLATIHGDGHRPLGPLHSIAEFCFAVSTETVSAVGGADEGFGLGPCWEMEYAARAARAGRPAVWVGAAYVWRFPATRRRLEHEDRWFDASRRRYQDRLCGLRLNGTATHYDSHCTGDACDHFAPPDRIVVHLPIGPRPAGVATSPPPTPPSPSSSPRPVVPQPLGRRSRLVSCVMPTADRPEWVAQAISYFRRQDHLERELVIVDDGADDLRAHAELRSLLHDPGIVHVRLATRASIGAKRNIGCQRAGGDVIVQWDDDDWYGPGRLSRQAAPILAGAADVTGLRDAPWFDVGQWRFRVPTPALHRRLFIEDVHGGTLAFHRRVWEQGARYPDASLAEDAWFLRNAIRRGARLAHLPASGVYLYVRHGTNSWQLLPGADRPDAWDAVPEPSELAADRHFYHARSAAAPATRPTGDAWRPTASCLMPTADRRQFLPAAVAGFLAQRYADAELLVVDDGADPAADLLPDDPRITYVKLDGQRSLGEKRNLAVEATRGEVLVHFDDDDWSHPDRIRVQVDALRAGTAELCGLARMLWWDPERRAAWRYTCPPLRRPWVAGNTLAYLRSAWQRAPFPAQTVGEDTAFVWGLATRRVLPIDDERLVIGTLHAHNTSTKHTDSAAWTPVDAAEILRVFADVDRSAPAAAPGDG